MARKTKSESPIPWKTSAQIMALVERKGLKLFVGLQPIDDDTWGVLALETPVVKKKKAQTFKQSGQAILDNHAHELIGTYDLATALQVANGYIRQWLRGEKPSVEKCECGEIGDATKGTLKEKPPTTTRLTKKEIDAAMRAAAN